MNYSGLQWLASIAFGRMLFCLVEGTVLAALTAIVVRMLQGKSSHTRFVLWLTALVASATLPLLLFSGWSNGLLSGASTGESVTVPVQVAEYIFLVWATLALAGLFRVAVGVAGLHRLRSKSQELDLGSLTANLRGEVEAFRKRRKVRMLVSSQLSVPTAIGFFRPAIVLPQWMVEEGAEDELRHVLLHELAHLRRWDDWTNLLQKVIKAVLFFHPAVWWMERRVSLDREMACDDAVLASTGTPRIYAELLARMAEKTFLRRQMELAQAAVGHLKQLSRRVARIIDPKREVANRFWRPAAPVAVVLALVTGAGLSWVPGLVKVGGEQVIADKGLAPAKSVEIPAQPVKGPAPAASDLFHAAKFAEPVVTQRHRVTVKAHGPVKPSASQQTASPLYQTAKQNGEVNPQRKFLIVVQMQKTVVATPDGWRVSVTETRWLIPAKASRPQSPNKT